jgi:hypothetical protein
MVIISSRGFTSVPGGGPLRGPFWPFVPLLSGRSMEMKSRCMTSAILWVLAAAATAAGSSVGVPLPGLKADEGSNVSARSCSVTLVGDKATVELELAATSEQPALLIDGPLFGWLGGSEAYPDRHFPELEVDIDGTKVAPEGRFDAFIGGRDISSWIRRAGIDPWAITHSPPVVSPRQDPWAMQALEKTGAVQRSSDGYLAHWTARRMVRIPLKAAPQQRLQLSYFARPAIMQASPTEVLTDEREAAYCLSPKQMNARLHTRNDLPPVSIAEYSIATGIDGRAAPRILLTKSPNTASVAAARIITFACGPHGSPIAVAGNLTRRPVQADQAGNVRILEVAER